MRPAAAFSASATRKQMSLVCIDLTRGRTWSYPHMTEWFGRGIRAAYGRIPAAVEFDQPA
jgi:hypothetical protein